MKNIGNLLIIGIIGLYFVNLSGFERILGMVVRVSHFLLLLYVVWVLLFDFFRSLKKKLSEKFGFHIKRMRRKIYKLKRS
jgi:hypothetical protein